jgi:serine/threonine protein kinase
MRALLVASSPLPTAVSEMEAGDRYRSRGMPGCLEGRPSPIWPPTHGNAGVQKSRDFTRATSLSTFREAHFRGSGSEQPVDTAAPMRTPRKPPPRSTNEYLSAPGSPKAGYQPAFGPGGAWRASHCRSLHCGLQLPVIRMLETIGHYRIRRKIGEGGMGVVYEAWDERLGRAVAIKTVHEASKSGDARSRLWREARSLARVSHPRVCQVFDVLEDGKDLFLVLEFLEGRSLGDRVASGSIITSEAVSIERQILEALEALHDLGIVHRDLKPSNVFLTRHGVKLLDFGLARSTSPVLAADANQAATDTALTGPGLIVGTPQYMAPEQASGGIVGPAADIFAAGSILYEMLSGRRAFEGASGVDVLYAVLHRDPPPLGGSREIEALDHVIRRAIAKRPENRFASAREMLEAVDAVPLSGSTAHAALTRTVVRLIALPFRVLRRDEETDFLAYSLPDAISSSLSGIDSLIVRSSLVAARFEGPVDPKRIAAEAEVDAILTGSVMRAGEKIRLTCELVEAPSATMIWSETVTSSMQDLFKIQDELSARVAHSLMLPLSERERHIFRRDVPASAKGYEFYLRANQIAAVRSLENMRLARDLYLQCLDHDPDYAPAWARLGRVTRFIEKFGEDAEENLKRADEAFRKAFALNPDLAIAHNLYTAIECDQGRAPQAMVRLLGRARFHRNDPDLFAGLVQACRYSDELEASVAAYQRARLLDPHVVTSITHTYFLLGDYQKTLECYGTKGGFYLDCAAMVMLGDNETALAKLREREQVGAATGTVRAIIQSLRAYLEGDFAECLSAIQAGEPQARKDPECLYYMARHLAQINQQERAIKILSNVIESGFLCGSAVARDPWLAPLRSLPGYSQLLHIAEQRRSPAHAGFLEAGGPRLLNMA